MLARPDVDRPGLERRFHLAKLVLDLREAVVLVDDLALGHVELGRDDLVVSEELVERAELLVVDHRRELRAVKDVPGLPVEDVLPKEPPQALALRRRDPEAARICLELLDEREEGRVLVQLALVKRLAPVDDDLLLELPRHRDVLPVLVLFGNLHRPLHDPGLAAEVRVRGIVSLRVDRPVDLLSRAFPQTFRDDVAVAGVGDVAHVRPRVHAAVRDEDEALQSERVDRLLHRGSERVVVEGVAGEHAERDRDPLVVKEKPELDDGLLAVLLAHAHLAKAFLDDVAVRVRRVGVRSRGLEEEVRHVVEDDLRATPRSARHAGVHAPHDLLRVPLDDVERVVDVVVVRAGDQGPVVLVVLAHRRGLRRGIEQTPVCEEPDDPREVVSDLRRELDAGEELVEPEGVEHRVEDRRRHALRLAEALRVTFLEGDRDPALRGIPDIGLERLDEGLPGLERFAQTPEVVRLAVVVTGQGTKVQHVLAAVHGFSVDLLESERGHETEIGRVVVLETFNIHRKILQK